MTGVDRMGRKVLSKGEDVYEGKSAMEWERKVREFKGFGKGWDGKARKSFRLMILERILNWAQKLCISTI